MIREQKEQVERERERGHFFSNYANYLLTKTKIVLLLQY